MLRLVQRLPSNRLFTHLPAPSFSSRLLASRAGADYDEAELKAARQWLQDLDPATIPHKLCDVSFSRSSGPGGQHVNKTASKATLRIASSTLLPLVPKPLHSSILASRYHAPSSGDIVIQADDSRKQAQNAEACHRRLIEMLREAGHDSVPGETSAEQRARVKQLQEADKEATKKMKTMHSAKKAARRGNGRD